MIEHKRKQVILILGMHRSGTSLLTRILNLHGVVLAPDITKPNEFNERGYWESRKAQEINDLILNELHTSWFDCYGLQLSEISKVKAELYKNKIIDYLNTSFSEADCVLFAIKDPRICKLLPIWQNALEAFGAEVAVIIPFRNPLEVAESLEKRDGLSKRHGLALWLRYLLDSEKYSRGLNRTFISFDGLLSNWESGVRRVAQELGLPWPELTDAIKTSVDSFISTDLKHHKHADGDLNGFGFLGSLVTQVYAAINATELGKFNETISAKLDAVLEQMDGVLQRPKDVAPEVVRKHFSHQRHLKLLNVEESKLLEIEFTYLMANFAQELSSAELVSDQQSKLTAALKSREKLAEQLSEFEKEYQSLNSIAKDREKELGEIGSRLAEVFKSLGEEKQIAGRSIDDLESLILLFGKVSKDLKVTCRENVNLLDQQAYQARKLVQHQSELEERTQASQLLQIEMLQHGATILALNSEIIRRRKENKSQADNLGLRFNDIAMLTRKIEEYEKSRSGRFLTIFDFVVAGVRGRWALAKISGTRKLVKKSELFDQQWYLQHYPDVLQKGIDPISHYLLNGAEEGRNPGPNFDSYAYLLANPDVAVEQVNPLVHFIRFGAKEGRKLNNEKGHLHP